MSGFSVDLGVTACASGSRVSRLLHWAEAWIMPWSEIFNPAQEQTRGAGGCCSYLTALDHLLGAELQGPVSALLADFTQLFLLSGGVQAAAASLGKIPRKPGKAADSHFCQERGVQVRHLLFYSCLSP